MPQTTIDPKAFMAARDAYQEAQTLHAARRSDFEDALLDVLTELLSYLAPRIGLTTVEFSTEHEYNDEGGTYEVKSLEWHFEEGLPNRPRTSSHYFRSYYSEHGTLFDPSVDEPGIGDDLVLDEVEDPSRFMAVVREAVQAAGGPEVVAVLREALNEQVILFSMTTAEDGTIEVQLEN